MRGNQGTKFFKNNIFMILASFVSVVIVCEILALLIAYFLPYIGLAEDPKVFLDYRTAFHPLITGRPLSPDVAKLVVTLPNGELANIFDPWFGWRNKGGTERTDDWGFTLNTSGRRDISRKLERTYRIFMIGSSPIVGFAIPKEETIPAKLERILNSSRWARSKNMRFQVINAGVVAWYSAQEVAQAQFELLYYEPDMIISFDGGMDMVAADSMHRNVKERRLVGERYYWNWVQQQLASTLFEEKIYTDLIKKAWLSSEYNPARYFYSLNLVCYKLPGLWESALQRSKKRKLIRQFSLQFPSVPPLEHWIWAEAAKLKKLEPWDVIDTAPATGGFLYANRLVRNLKNLKAVCAVNDIEYMAILEPNLLPDLKKTFSDIEKFHYGCKLQIFFDRNQSNFRTSAMKYYDKAAMIAFEDLGSSFFDFSKIFLNEPRTVYLDSVHYNSLGTEIIAQKLSGLIEAKMDRLL